jgi:Holliday junction DNA helicase RuvB
LDKGLFIYTLKDKYRTKELMKNESIFKRKRPNVKNHLENILLFRNLQSGFYFFFLMEIKRITTTQTTESKGQTRPSHFDDFIGQEQIKKMLKTAIGSAKKRDGTLGHILFAGPSGFGKTTMAHLIAHQLETGVKMVTAYAISKPSEIVSLLNSLESGEVLFIDEIHRLKPTIEEVLYIAMEDFVIDMVMPEG